MHLGGFPLLHTAGYSVENAYKVVYDIYTSVLLRDTVERHHIRDVELLERVVKYAFDNIGSTFSGKNVADYFKSQQRKIEQKEIDFIGEKQGQKIQVQVAYKLENEQTVEWEFGNLLSIPDQYPKFVVSMDDFWGETVEGIQHYYLSDFLLSDVF